MTVTKWFDRKFDLGNKQYIMPSVIERLEGTAVRIQEKLKKVPPKYYTAKQGDSWSLLEQVGHLWDLEDLWQRRLDGLMRGETEMAPADLANTKTHEARHNEKSINVLLNNFNNARAASLARLRAMSEQDAFRQGIHPRLKTGMTLQDLCIFVAEHDDHHLAKMTEIIGWLTAQGMTGSVQPNDAPFVSLNSITARELIPGYEAKFVHTGNVTLAFWKVKAGAKLPVHNHRHEQLSIMTKGKFELTIKDETRVVAPGDVAVIPSNDMHGAVAVTDCEIIDVFSPVRIDYL